VSSAPAVSIVVHPGFARLERLQLRLRRQGEPFRTGNTSLTLRDRDGDEPAGVSVRQPNGDHGEPEHLDDALGDPLRGVSLMRLRVASWSRSKLVSRATRSNAASRWFAKGSPR